LLELALQVVGHVVQTGGAQVVDGRLDVPQPLVALVPLARRVPLHEFPGLLFEPPGLVVLALGLQLLDSLHHRLQLLARFGRQLGAGRMLLQDLVGLALQPLGILFLALGPQLLNLLLDLL
jgi:hypothetical protein